VRTVCEQARERLSRQLDDDLSTHETALLDRHLLGCPTCAAFATQARAYTEMLRSAALEPAPQFWLPRRPVTTRLTTRVAAVTAAAAAAALVAVSSLSLQGGQSHSSGAFDFWPRGLAVHPRSDENLGVQRAAFLPRAGDGPRGRGEFRRSV
jgi:anti-sigma factor RsiW